MKNNNYSRYDQDTKYEVALYYTNEKGERFSLEPRSEIYPSFCLYFKSFDEAFSCFITSTIMMDMLDYFNSDRIFEIKQEILTAFKTKKSDLQTFYLSRAVSEKCDQAKIEICAY